MSADNWTICPQCKLIAEKKHEKNLQEVTEMYGKIPIDEFLDRTIIVNKLDSSLREDYELGIDEDGEFYVYFSASCEECGFKFSFKETRKLELKEE
jgi:hypothetical protein